MQRFYKNLFKPKTSSDHLLEIKALLVKVADIEIPVIVYGPPQPGRPNPGMIEYRRSREIFWDETANSTNQSIDDIIKDINKLLAVVQRFSDYTKQFQKIQIALSTPNTPVLHALRGTVNTSVPELATYHYRDAKTTIIEHGKILRKVSHSLHGDLFKKFCDYVTHIFQEKQKYPVPENYNLSLTLNAYYIIPSFFYPLVDLMHKNKNFYEVLYVAHNAIAIDALAQEAQAKQKTNPTERSRLLDNRL